MRILLFVGCDLLILKGGIAELILSLKKGLEERGHTVILFGRDKQKTKNYAITEDSWNGISYFKGALPSVKWWQTPTHYQSFRDFCLNQKIDLVHVQGIYSTGHQVRLALKKTNIPYGVTSHSDILAANAPRINRFHIKRRIKKILHDAAFVTHLSPHMKTAADSFLKNDNKSFMIGNGIDLTAWPMNPLSTLNYFFSIGRLVHDKGFDILINAYALSIKKYGVASHLVIAGEGEEENNLKTLSASLGFQPIILKNPSEIAKLNKPSIIFVGFLNHEEKKDWYASALSVLFAPRWVEAYGIVQLEAAISGKLLIASDNEATQYLQSQGLQAYIHGLNDLDGWAESLKKVVDEKEKCRLLGEKNLTFAKRHSWKNIISDYEKVYAWSLKG